MDDVIRQILGMETWAVVGWSPGRDSEHVGAFLERQGKRVLPVHPVHGAPSLLDIDMPIDVVDIFRRSECAGAHVDEAIEIGARAVWLQLGVVDDAAAQRARDAGLLVVMDRCPAIEWPRLAAADRAERIVHERAGHRA
jgi:predicted CoA-binding protein